MMAGWIAGILLALAVGLMAGVTAGEHKAREEIARDCRHGGTFSLRRTGFACEVIRKEKAQ